MLFHLPEEVHDQVHRTAVVEFLFELHALAGHLDADEHIQQAWNKLLREQHEVVLKKKTMTQVIHD